MEQVLLLLVLVLPYQLYHLRSLRRERDGKGQGKVVIRVVVCFLFICSTHCQLGAAPSLEAPC